MVHFEAGGDAERARAYAELAADRAAAALAFEPRRRALPPRARRGPRARRAPDQARARAGPRRARRRGGARVPRRHARRRARRRRSISAAAPPSSSSARATSTRGSRPCARCSAPSISRCPKTPARALASLLYHRARLALRGLGFSERERPPSPEELTRIDVCWSVGNGLNGVDVVRGADFQARHLLYALEAGEPYRIARALASEARLRRDGGRARRPRARRAPARPRGREIAERIGHPHAVAWTAGARAGATFYAAAASARPSSSRDHAVGALPRHLAPTSSGSSARSSAGGCSRRSGSWAASTRSRAASPPTSRRRRTSAPSTT